MKFRIACKCMMSKTEEFYNRIAMRKKKKKIAGGLFTRYSMKPISM
jgi:hypothetical protein